MSACAVCGIELHEGYEFCLHCGATVGEGDESGPELVPATGFADLVDQAKDVSSRAKNLAESANASMNTLLGSPISTQRQIIYALFAGFALVSTSPVFGIRDWLQGWLVVSVLLMVPIHYWITGVFPLAGLFNTVLGSELGLRRRLVLALVWGSNNFMIGWLLFLLLGLSSMAVSSSGSPSQNTLGTGLLELRVFVGNYLVTFYLMGFTSSWRSASGCDSHISREGMAERADNIAKKIRDLMEARKIPRLERTVVEMSKLRRYTAGASSGRQGEQLSFVCGRARVVVFVQDFGDGLFIRWTGFLEFSGRRLWLYYGFLVTILDRWAQRWFGSSPILLAQQWTRALSVGSRNHLVLREGSGGFISRTLLLVEGVSEYSWNELHALNYAVQESVIAALQVAVGDHDEAERIRSRIERDRALEMRSGWSSGRANH